MDLHPRNDRHGSALITPFDDQIFLLNFITGTYLGPDLTLSHERTSAFQRKSKDSPPYVATDLGPSYVSVAMLENLYYYILRKALPSLILNPNTFHDYLKGKLHLPNSKQAEETRQFTSIFPLDVHHQIWYPESFRVVKGIVLIDDPMTSHLEDRDVEKFKSLSRVGSLKIDMNEFQNFEHSCRDGDESNANCSDNGLETIAGNDTNGNSYPLVKTQQQYKRRAKQCSKVGDSKRSCVSDEAAIMSVVSIAEVEKCMWESDASVVLSGSARRGKSGPPIGVVDVGVSKAAYYFRVVLPGVRKDYCNFSCEIESEGRVHVRGLTGGGKTIKKPSRVFEMKLRQLCPCGPFTVSFSLPGPVDPRLFAPNFRSDGIFEGVIIKHTKNGT